VAFGNASQFGTRQCRAVGGEQRKALEDQTVRNAELADGTVPATVGVTAVLHESRRDTRLAKKALKLFECDVADAEKARPAAVVNRFHRTPGGPVVRSQTRPLSRTMQ